MPSSLRDALEAMFRLWTRTLRTTFAPALVASLAVLAPWWWLPPSDSIEGIAYAIIEWAPRTDTWLLFAIAAAVSAHSCAALVHCQAASRRGGTATLADGLRDATRRLPAVLLGTTLYLALLAACCLPTVAAMAYAPMVASDAPMWTLIVLGMVVTLVLLCWAMLAFGLFMHVLLIERCGPAAALLRSARLVQDHWWRTSAIVSVPMLVHMGVVGGGSTFALGFAASVALALYGADGFMQARWLLAGHVLLAPVNALVVPLIFAGLQVAYDDLVVRQARRATA